MKRALRLAVSLLSCALLAACSRPPAPPGQLYDVGGHSLHIACSGTPQPGRPTVILEGGLGNLSPFLYWIQSGTAAFARVCAYDRAGLAWSGDGGRPHDAAEIVRQLHVLLGKAQVEPPYVLVGHSLAGLVLPVFVAAYPDEVAGLVLLDPSHPRQWSLLPGAADGVAKAKRMYSLLGYAAALGATHLYNPLLASAGIDRFPAAQQAQLRYFGNRSSTYFTARAEFDAFDASAREAAAVTSLGDRPLTVVSAGYVPADASGEGAARAGVAHRLHAEIAALSARGRHVTIPGATHLSLVADETFAGQVVVEIRRVLEQAAR